MRVPVLRTTIFLTLTLASATGCSSGSSNAAAPAAATAPGAAASASTSPASAGSSAGGGSGQDLNACGLLTMAQATALTGKHYSAAKAQMIAPGQDQCSYASPGDSDLVVIVYQPSSGVTWQMMASVLSGTGKVTNVSGVGDKAMVGSIELDAQAGRRLIAVQGAGGTLTGDYSDAAAVAEAVITALH